MSESLICFAVIVGGLCVRLIGMSLPQKRSKPIYNKFKLTLPTRTFWRGFSLLLGCITFVVYGTVEAEVGDS